MKTSDRLKRGSWIALGTVFLGVGGVGVAVPVLPTTPFLLLAAFCYARGSRRLHERLLASKYLGAYIRAYEKGEGINTMTVVGTLAFLWAGLIVSGILIGSILVMAILTVIGILVSIHVISLRKAR